MAYRPVYYTFTILSMAVLGESKIQISQQGQCPSLTYFYHDPDWKLEGRVVATHYVSSEDMCYAACIRDTRCRSLNFERKKDPSTQSHRCEINYSKKQRHPSSFLPRNGWTYQEISNDNLPELEPAKITARPSSRVVVEEGQDVSLNCAATGQPAPKVRWERSDGKVINGAPKLDHKKLALLNVSSEHEASFTCEASNEVSAQPDRATVTVTVVPVPRFIVVPPRNINASTGSRVQIDCKGTKGCKITWGKKGGTLPENHLKYSNGTLVLMEISQDSAGQYVCNAKTVFTSVTAVTHIILMDRSCSHLKAANPTLESGYYTIDPDGVGGEDPFTVYCYMSDKNGVGVTVVSHDSEKRIFIELCDPPGCSIRNVTYTGLNIAQLANLEKISVHCEQFITFQCYQDAAFIEDKFAWWVSRDGKPMYYWGGASPGSGKCACGMSGTCAGGAGCNCMQVPGISSEWEDSGLLTDKASLPVTQLRFGDNVGFEIYNSFKLGKFKCHSVISTPVPVTIESRPSSLTAEAGQDVTFTCVTTGHPQPIVSWKRSDGSGLSTVYWKIVGTNLTLLHVASEDEGTYICETKYGNVTLTASFSLQVSGFTVRPPRLVTAPEGAWVWLPCQAAKHNNISWERKNGNLTNNHLQYSNGTLLLMNITRNDSDVYICSISQTSLKTKTKVRIGNLSCSHLKELAHQYATSGNCTIDPDGEGGEDAFTVYCELSEGGWIVIQKRVNGTTRFNLSHEKYTIGFGNFEREFWLGLNKIHALTTSDRFILRVELEDWDGSTAFAEYDNFVVGNESSGYKLEKLGRYKGTAGDSLFYYKGRQWTTMEQGSWWKHPLILWEKYYDEQRKQVSLTLSSPYSNLNGKYGRHVNPSDAGIMWSRWKGRFYSLKRTQMKIRLAPFVQF